MLYTCGSLRASIAALAVAAWQTIGGLPAPDGREPVGPGLSDRFRGRAGARRRSPPRSSGGDRVTDPVQPADPGGGECRLVTGQFQVQAVVGRLLGDEHDPVAGGRPGLAVTIMARGRAGADRGDGRPGSNKMPCLGSIGKPPFLPSTASGSPAESVMIYSGRSACQSGDVPYLFCLPLDGPWPGHAPAGGSADGGA